MTVETVGTYTSSVTMTTEVYRLLRLYIAMLIILVRTHILYMNIK